MGSRSPVRRSTRSPARTASIKSQEKITESKSPPQKAATSKNPQSRSRAKTKKQAAAKSKSRSGSRSRSKREKPKSKKKSPSPKKVSREYAPPETKVAPLETKASYEYQLRAGESRFGRPYMTATESGPYLRRPIQAGTVGLAAPRMKKMLLTRAQIRAVANRVSANVRHYAPLYSFILLLLLVFGSIYYTGYKVGQVIKHFQNQVHGYIGSLKKYTTNYFEEPKDQTE